MKWFCGLVALSACGSTSATSSSPSTPSTLSNTVEAPRGTSAASTRELIARSFTEIESGIAYDVWLGTDRVGNIDTNDPCCGLSYDGNRYDDKLATCVVGHDDCAPGQAPVYPGLADDRVCGPDERRCVPLPRVRLIVRDDTDAMALDGEGMPLAAVGHDPTRVQHELVEIGRTGFVFVTIAERTERVALDYGGRYTITVGNGRVERVNED